MKLYCMCHRENDKPESQAFMAPNRYHHYDEESDYRTFVLTRSMVVDKNGAKQFLPDGLQPNKWDGEQVDVLKQHHKGVDVHICPHCNARVAVE